MRSVLLRSCGRGLLLLAAVLSLSVTSLESFEPTEGATPHTDRFGDPLPVGAVSRLGTNRWRYPPTVGLVQFLQEGRKLLASGEDGVIHISDTATGKEIQAFWNRAW